jgi:hypothetical protein
MMFDGIKTVSLAVAGTVLAGAILGVFIGALTDEYLLWIGILAGSGFVLGIILAYGFLPES